MEEKIKFLDVDCHWVMNEQIGEDYAGNSSLCFLFAPNSLLTAKKANSSAVVTGCRENISLVNY